MLSKDAVSFYGGPAVRITLTPPASLVRTVEGSRLPRTRAHADLPSSAQSMQLSSEIAIPVADSRRKYQQMLVPYLVQIYAGKVD